MQSESGTPGMQRQLEKVLASWKKDQLFAADVLWSFEAALERLQANPNNEADAPASPGSASFGSLPSAGSIDADDGAHDLPR